MNRYRAHFPGPRAVPGSQRFAPAATWKSSHASVRNLPAASQGRLAVRSGSLALFIFALLLLPLSALAHDPYEITSTVRLETNRTEVEIEMELPAAMLLAGFERPRAAADAPAIFAAALPELQRQAAQFFEIVGGTGPLTATATNVQLGVEDHVKFNLRYPASPGGVRLRASGLKSLTAQGPFGTSVTVMDMVNMKVLGQPVLFADSPAVEFAPATSEVAAIVRTSSDSTATNPVPASPSSTPTATAPTAAPCCNGRWVLLVAGVIGVISIWLLGKSKK